MRYVSPLKQMWCSNEDKEFLFRRIKKCIGLFRCLISNHETVSVETFHHHQSKIDNDVKITIKIHTKKSYFMFIRNLNKRHFLDSQIQCWSFVPCVNWIRAEISAAVLWLAPRQTYRHTERHCVMLMDLRLSSLSSVWEG